MHKKSLVGLALVGLLLVGGGAYAYTKNQNNQKEQDKMAMEKQANEAGMLKKQQTEAMAKDAMAKTEDSMMEDDAMAKHGSYVTLADYTKAPSAYVDSKKVYFFHASWCPICQGIDKEITTDMTKLPAGVTLIKTDFDSSTELRKKYGVTTQYTFVQVDASGNETAQWSATSLSDALAGIRA